MPNLQLKLTYNQIIKIAIPISFAILIPQLNFFINTFFLSQLGETALGIAGITGVYYLVFTSIGYGLNNGLQSLISRKAGENKPKEIGVLFIHGIVIALILALVGIISTYTILPFILKKFLHDSNTVHTAIQYLQIRIWGLPFLYMYQMRNALLVGTNQSKYLPYGTTIETLVNILLDYALIFGHFGLPQLGFNGAAFASIIAEFTGMFVTFLIIKYKGISKQFGIFVAYNFNKLIIKNILNQSGPLMFQHAISIISWLFFFLLIGRTQNQVLNLAISNTMRNIFGLFGVITWALGSTTNTIVSNAVGQGKINEVPFLVKKIIFIAVGAALFFSLVLNIFPQQIFHIFSKDVSFIIAAVPVIRVISLAMIVMSISVVCLNTVIGLGKSKYAFYIELCTIFIYLLYTYIAMEIYKVPIHFAWMNEWLYWFFMLIFAYIFLQKRFKQICKNNFLIRTICPK